MRRAAARLPVCFLTLLVALIVSPARAEKQYCTPEAYLPAQIEASLKVCDALIAYWFSPALKTRKSIPCLSSELEMCNSIL